MEEKIEMIEAHIFREKGGSLEFLLLKRSKAEIYPGLWQMVTGSVEAGEKAPEAAIREIKEETGLSPRRLWTVPHINSFYSVRKDKIIFIPVFAALTNAEEILLSEEHVEFAWFPPDKAIELLAWEGQRKSVKIITDYYLYRREFLDMLEIKL
jgi:dATP pyrophosphohydrolase